MAKLYRAKALACEDAPDAGKPAYKVGEEFDCPDSLVPHLLDRGYAHVEEKAGDKELAKEVARAKKVKPWVEEAKKAKADHAKAKADHQKSKAAKAPTEKKDDDK